MSKGKPLSEEESRKRLYKAARKAGFEEALQKIFKRYDELQAHAKTAAEKKALAMLGLQEINNLFNIGPVYNFQDPKSGLEANLVVDLSKFDKEEEKANKGK